MFSRSIVDRSQSLNSMHAAAIAVLFLGSLVPEAVAEDIPDALGQAWQRRQDAVATARFEWQSDRGDGSTPFASSFLFDGRKCRYTTHHDGEYLSTFDGNRGMRWHAGRGGGGPVGTGAILSQPVFDDALNVHLKAITLCLRPLDPNFDGGAPLSDFEIVSRDDAVDGRSCMLLRQRADASKHNVVFLLYVDPERDFVVLRWATEVDGKLWAQLDIAYAQDAVIGWVPSGWNLFMPRGTNPERYTCTVTDYALNEPLSDKLFVIDFPPGTYVVNRASGEQYLLRDGGEKRFIAPAEKGRATWGELMATDYGKAGIRTIPQRPDRTLFRLAWMTIAGLLALGILVYLVKRRRSS
jgi:hypothetical protein